MPRHLIIDKLDMEEKMLKSKNDPQEVCGEMQAKGKLANEKPIGVVVILAVIIVIPFVRMFVSGFNLGQFLLSIAFAAVIAMIGILIDA